MMEDFKADKSKEEYEKESKQLLYLCLLVEPNLDKDTRKEEVKSHHSIPNDIPRKTRKANKKGMITERMNEKALEAKLKEESSGDHVH